MRQQSNVSGTPAPTVHVTVNKNRLKQYSQGGGVERGCNTSSAEYFLKNDQTFELELFNPTNNVVKADIHLNGDNISGGGLVLKPGERVYLERYIESNNKFLFETYEVEDSGEVAKAIAKNGKLKVEFFSEFTKQPFLRPYPNTRHCSYAKNFESSGNNTNLGMDFITTTTNGLGFTNISTQNMTLGSGEIYTSSTDMVFEENSLSFDKVETGRVGKGEASNQEFQMYEGEFITIPFEVVEYQLKPISQQPITKDSLSDVRHYCHECGTKVNSKDKFCRKCGEKL